VEEAEKLVVEGLGLLRWGVTDDPSSFGSRRGFGRESAKKEGRSQKTSVSEKPDGPACLRATLLPHIWEKKKKAKETKMKIASSQEIFKDCILENEGYAGRGSNVPREGKAA